MRDELSSQPLLDGELLRAFAAFASTLSFTRAARRIGLSQPALFDRVRRLSEAVGAPLYRREGQALQLTDTGVTVAAFARSLLQQTHGFAQQLEGVGLQRVVLAAGEGAYLYLLGPALAEISARGELELVLHTRGGPATARAVASGEAHLGIGVYDLLPEGTDATELISTSLCAAVPEHHPLALRETVTLSELASHRLIVAPSGQHHRELISRAVASLGAPLIDPVEASGWPLMLSFAAAGLGVAVVNGICTPPPGVVLRRLPQLGTLTYWLLRRSGAPPSPGAEALADQIVAHVRPS